MGPAFREHRRADQGHEDGCSRRRISIPCKTRHVPIVSPCHSEPSRIRAEESSALGGWGGCDATETGSDLTPGQSVSVRVTDGLMLSRVHFPIPPSSGPLGTALQCGTRVLKPDSLPRDVSVHWASTATVVLRTGLWTLAPWPPRLTAEWFHCGACVLPVPPEPGPGERTWSPGGRWGRMGFSVSGGKGSDRGRWLGRVSCGSGADPRGPGGQGQRRRSGCHQEAGGEDQGPGTGSFFSRRRWGGCCCCCGCVHRPPRQEFSRRCSLK